MELIQMTQLDLFLRRFLHNHPNRISMSRTTFPSFREKLKSPKIRPWRFLNSKRNQANIHNKTLERPLILMSPHPTSMVITIMKKALMINRGRRRNIKCNSMSCKAWLVKVFNQKLVIALNRLKRRLIRICAQRRQKTLRRSQMK